MSLVICNDVSNYLLSSAWVFMADPSGDSQNEEDYEVLKKLQRFRASQSLIWKREAGKMAKWRKSVPASETIGASMVFLAFLGASAVSLSAAMSTKSLHATCTYLPAWIYLWFEICTGKGTLSWRTGLSNAKGPECKPWNLRLVMCQRWSLCVLTK